MSMRDKIAEIIFKDVLTTMNIDGMGPYNAADAIIADLSDALVRAAVYRAADVARRDEVYQNHVTVSKIRALADDPEAKAAIKAKAGWA